MFECPGTALRQPRYRHPDEQGLGRSVFGEGKTGREGAETVEVLNKNYRVTNFVRIPFSKTKYSPLVLLP